MSDSLLHRFTCVISKSFFARGIVREQPTLPAWSGLEPLEPRLLLSTDSNPIALGSPPSIPGGSVYIGPVPDYSPLAHSIAIPILPEPEDAVWLPSGVHPMFPPPPPPGLYWDPDGNSSNNNYTTGAGLGGNGNWNLTSYYWYNSSTSSYVQWSNSNSATAVFMTPPTTTSTVTLTTGITAAGTVKFSTSGYTVTGNTLTLTSCTTVENSGDAVIASTIAGSAGLTKTGSGTLTLSGSNTYSGCTSIQAGTLKLGGNNSLPTGTTVTLGNSTNSGTLKLNGYTQELAGLAISGTGSSNRVVNDSATAGALTLNTCSCSYTVSAILGGSSADEKRFGLTKKGSWTLTLSGANSYTCGTAIQAGTLVLGGSSALPTGTMVTLGPCDSATLKLNGYSLEVNGLTTCGTGGSNRVINGGGAGATLTVNTSSGDSTFAGVLGSSCSCESNLGLTKTGSGTLTLSSCNSYTGATTISGGVLRAGLGTGLPNASNLVFSGGVLETSGTFERSLGTCGSEVRWLGDGGFSAYGGQLTVAIGGTCNPTELTWGGTNFVQTDDALLFGSAASDNQVLFVNNINMGAAAREVLVNDNPNCSCDKAELSGGLSWTNGLLLTKSGGGTLVLSGTVTVHSPGEHTLTISDGALQLDTPITSTETMRILPGAGQLTGSAPVYGKVIRYRASSCGWQEVICGCATNNGDCPSYSSSDLPGLTRTFANKAQYAPDMGLGQGWNVLEWPSLVTTTPTSQHVIVRGGAPREWFGDNLAGHHGTLDTLTGGTNGQDFVLTDPQGNVTRFSDEGAFKSFTDPAGNKTEATYDENGKLVEVERAFPGDEAEQTLESLTRTDDTATATLTDHGYEVGDWVQISGAEQSAYNGSFRITSASTDTFTYTISGSPTSPATGTIKVTRLGHDCYTVTYDSDRIGRIELSHVLGGQSPAFVRRVDYDYYYGNESPLSGNVGDLKTAIISDSSGTIETKYYRYYTPDDCTVTEGGANKLKGYPHALKFALEGDSYARLQASGGSTASEDSELLSFATVYNEYDGEHRLAKAVRAAEGCSVCGGTGQGTYTYTYARSNNPEDYNNWRCETVMDLPASVGQQITYCNYAGQVMLEVFAASGQEWRTYHKYDNGREILTADAAAVTGYDPCCADLLNELAGNYTYLSDNAGLITVTDYSTSTTATTETPGEVEHYVHTTSIKHGETGTPVLQTHMDYIASPTVGDTTVYPVNSVTTYSGTDGTGQRTTSYSYTWFASTLQIQSQQTTHPLVSTGHNGRGAADSTTTFFDTFGRPIWVKDEDGFIFYTEYDPATGAVVKTIADVDTTKTDDFANLPQNWSTPSGGGLHLVTLYEVDSEGRTTKVTDPNGNVTYTVYKDAQYTPEEQPQSGTFTILREVRTYPGWTAENTTTAPIQIHREVVFDYAGNSNWSWFTEDLTVAVTPDVSSNRPTGNDAFDEGDIRSLSRSYVNVSGQVVTSDSYYSTVDMTYSLEPDIGLATANYLRTTYAYCVRGWVNRTVHPDGTIERTAYHPIGRVVSQWVGTDDTPTSGQWSPDNTTGANMVETVHYYYDQATPGSGSSGVGDGNVTEARTLYGSGEGEYYKTVYEYDWRNRLTDARGPDNVATKTTYNNLGEATLVETYADADTDFVVDSGELRGKVERAYDELGRVYRMLTYEVDPETGDDGDRLASDVWYNPRGMVAKTSDANGLFQKAAYDGAGRSVVSYLCYDDDEDPDAYEDAQTVDGDTVIQQVQSIYDRGSRLVARLRFQRLETDTTSTGPLTADMSYATATVVWYDAVGRTTYAIDFGHDAPSGTPYIFDDGDLIDTDHSEQIPADGIPDEADAWNDVTQEANSPREPNSSNDYIVAKYQYNDAGLPYRVTDNKGHITQTDFDLLGRTTKTIANYDDGEVLETMENADTDQTTVYLYDSAGRLATLRALNPKGDDSNPNNENVENQDTTYLYESEIDRSWVTNVIYPDSSDTDGPYLNVYSLIRTGTTASVTTTTSHGYDTGAQVRITGADQPEYNGWFTITRDGDYTFHYTVSGSPVTPATGTIEVKKLGTDEVKTTYDRLGRKLTVTDQRGVVHTYAYDTAGRLASDAATTVPSGVDSSVRCISYRYYGTEQTVATLTRDGSTATVTLADHGYTTGNLVQISGAEQAAYNGSFTITRVDDDTFTYTVSGSPTYPATGAIKVKRLDSATGRLEAVTSWENADGTGDILSQVKFWYDGWGNVSRAYQSHGGTVDDDGQGTDTPCVQYAYDDGEVDGEAKYVRLSSVTYPNGSVVHYNYPADGVGAALSRLLEIADDGDIENENRVIYVQYTYLGAGTVVKVEHPAVADGDGLTLSYGSGGTYDGWDRFGRVLDQTWTVGESTVVDSYGYAYDGNSNRTERTNALNEDLDETYTYDGLDRLASTERDNSAYQSWILDGLGNWHGFTDQGDTQTREHNAANETGEISDDPDWIDPIYDAAGNMVVGPAPGDEETEQRYVYDAWNHLVQVTDDEDVAIATYRYDGLGRRIQKLLGPDPEDPTATYDYFYDESWQAVEVRLDGDPDPLDQYVWDVRYIDAPVVRFHDGNTDGDLDGGSQEGDNTLYYTTDANFNVTALVDAETGEVVERYMYDPYGKATVCEEDWTPREDNASAVANDVLYCGYRFDAETGLYQVRFRYYHPTLGRWATRDPIDYAGEIQFYNYVRNVPTSLVDPIGLKWQYQYPATSLTSTPIPTWPPPFFPEDKWTAVKIWVWSDDRPDGGLAPHRSGSTFATYDYCCQCVDEAQHRKLDAQEYGEAHIRALDELKKEGRSGVQQRVSEYGYKHRVAETSPYHARVLEPGEGPCADLVTQARAEHERAHWRDRTELLGRAFDGQVDFWSEWSSDEYTVRTEQNAVRAAVQFYGEFLLACSDLGVGD